jgi:hypothetical protein
VTDTDPVDTVLMSFLDFVEGTGAQPTLEHLSDPDRSRAQALMSIVGGGRGLDPHTNRPSVEALLEETPLAGLFRQLSPAEMDRDSLATLGHVLDTVDSRARVDLDPATSTVVYTYLDLRARFLPVMATAPVLTDAVRRTVEALFEADPDTSRVGVVALGSSELVTQVISADDLGETITTPDGGPHLRWAPRLPLTLAAQRMLELTAPQWPSFDFDQTYGGALDLPAVAADIARSVIAREAARSYRGDKKRAYRELVGQEQVFADLVTLVATRNRTVDLEAETSRILRAAA